jgi:peroxiredoxin
MAPIGQGARAPAIPDLDFSAGPTALFFYKVTCPVCQMAAPKAHSLATRYPERIAGIGQDPQEKLSDFEGRFGLGFPVTPDPPPYPVSNDYGIQVVPTLFLIDSEGVVLEAVESWDRDGYNAVSKRLSDLTGSPYVPISQPGDGLPAFRPG